MVAQTTHRPSHNPSATSGEKRPITKGMINAVTTETASAQRSLTHNPGSVALFQLAMGPTAMRNTAGAMSG